MALAGVTALFARDKSGFCIDLFVRIAILSYIERLGLINNLDLDEFDLHRQDPAWRCGTRRCRPRESGYVAGGWGVNGGSKPKGKGQCGRTGDGNSSKVMC